MRATARYRSRFRPRPRGPCHDWRRTGVLDSLRHVPADPGRVCRLLLWLKGAYTGTITVGDPNAIDAPQTITVTAEIGGNVPDQLVLYAAPGGSATAKFTTNQYVNTPVSTQNGQPWLAVAAMGVGSFNFGVTYTISAAPQSGTAAGDTHGSIGVSRLELCAGQQNRGRLLHVTTSPIAAALLAQSGFPHCPANLPNRRKPWPSRTAGRARWCFRARRPPPHRVEAGFSAESSGTAISVAADPSGLTWVFYQGSITVGTERGQRHADDSGAVGRLQRNRPRWPLSRHGECRHVSAERSDCAGEIMALFANNWPTDGPQSAVSTPLATQLGNTRVLVNGQAVPLFYSSYGRSISRCRSKTPWARRLVQVERNARLQHGVRAGRGLGARILPFGQYGVIQDYSQGNMLRCRSRRACPPGPAQLGGRCVILRLPVWAQTSPAARPARARPASSRWRGSPHR